MEKDFITIITETQRKIQRILSNTEYMDWLTNFTKEHDGFTDEDWLYFPEKISKSDLNFVEDLHLLYNGIEKYAVENYIYPITNSFGNFYKIKYNGNGFEIGTQVGQGVRFYCLRVDINDEQEYIDFFDTMNNKKCEYTKEFDNLSNIIYDLHRKGIPTKAIEESINKTINDITTKQNESVLTKKLTPTKE